MLRISRMFTALFDPAPLCIILAVFTVLFLGLQSGVYSSPRKPAADECTIDLSVRSARIGGTERDPGYVLSVNDTGCLSIRKPKSDHHVAILLDDKSGYIWLQGKNDGPIVAIYERPDHAVVGAYSPISGGRKRYGVDACVVAEKDGGRVQLLDKCANVKVLTADKVDPPKCDK